jgi:hypothetical protein
VANHLPPSLNMASEGSDFNYIFAQKYCTVWGPQTILLCNNIDHVGAA